MSTPHLQHAQPGHVLTANLVRTSRRGAELRVLALDNRRRARAVDLSASLLAVCQASVGLSRGDLAEAWAAVQTTPAERKLVQGLVKLIEDGSEFEGSLALEPRRVRRQVFLLAGQARHNGQVFRREAVLESAARELGSSPDLLEAALYADLKNAQKLTKACAGSAETLVERYEIASLQAVLLRAVELRADVAFASADGYRDLFRKLKFRRLLYSVEKTADGYRFQIDGPYSLFDSVTKYGLELALMLPVLLSADKLKLVARVLWGKQRLPLTFGIERERCLSSEPVEVALSEEVERFVEGFAGLGSSWKVRPALEVIDAPGVGVCVPDLEFTRADGRRVLMEILGYWSRDAVWKRVELVARGLPERWLFAVSSHLRVSEAVLDENSSSALYVYKRTMSPRSVLERLERLVADPSDAAPRERAR